MSSIQETNFSYKLHIKRKYLDYKVQSLNTSERTRYLL